MAPNADAKEVRSAFRSLARILHPDFNPSQDAAQRFVKVAQAYAVLSDPDDDAHTTPLAGPRRAFRRTALLRPDRRPRAAVCYGCGCCAVRNSVLARGGFRHSCARRRTRREVCALCLGRGAAEGGTSARCEVCNGTGGTRSGAGECSICQGSGVKGDPPCANCLGYGRKRGNTPLTVTIPPAVEDGQQLDLEGRRRFGAAERAARRPCAARIRATRPRVDTQWHRHSDEPAFESA